MLHRFFGRSMLGRIAIVRDVQPQADRLNFLSLTFFWPVRRFPIALELHDTFGVQSEMDLRMCRMLASE